MQAGDEGQERGEISHEVHTGTDTNAFAALHVLKYGDGNRVDSRPEASDAPPPDYSGKHNDNGMRRFFVDRHQRAINIGYTDGHIAKVKLRNLWIQNWHQGFVPNHNVKLPP